MLGHVTTPANTPPPPETPDDQPVPAPDAGHAPDAAPAPGPDPEPPAPTPAPVYAPAPGHPEAASPAAPAYAVPPGPPVGGTKNTLGLVALIIGVATLVLSSVTLVSQGVMLLQPDYDYRLINLVTTVFTSIGGLMALAAVVLGAIGLARKGAPKGAAGIGFGIGVATVWAILGNLIYSGILSLVY